MGDTGLWHRGATKLVVCSEMESETNEVTLPVRKGPCFHPEAPTGSALALCPGGHALSCPLSISQTKDLPAL